MKQKRATKLRYIVPVMILICFLAAAVVCGMLLSQRYLWAGGQLVSKSSTYLNFYDKNLSVEDYQELRHSLPFCDIRWNVPLQGGHYPSETDTLHINTLSFPDLEVLSLFPALSLLEVQQCADYSVLAAFQQQHPDCEVRCPVTIGGVCYPYDTEQLCVTNPAVEELQNGIPFLSRLSAVTLQGNLPSLDQINALQREFPEVTFCWEIPFGSEVYESTLRELDLSGQSVDYDAVHELLSWLPNLERVNLLNCPLTDENIIALSNQYPDILFLWEMNVAGIPFLTDVEEIDITGQTVESPEQIEKLLPCFRNLKKVIMSHCGLDDETMDALNQRHEDIRFVWSIKMQNYFVRTDADYFYPYKISPSMMVTDEDLEPLRYCTDLLCIDIGHMWYVTHCEWVRYMPKLRFLIIGETRISDITPLSSCKNLVYLEMFTIPVTDYSPLVECTALEDLCLGRTYGDPAPIAKMTWLKNLWWANVDGTYGLPASNAKEILTEALPNTNMRFNIAHPTAGGWRKLEHYFEMRDLMDMFYLQ